ncbi:NAD kinase [bioreactor metagenome]|uniref:NAD kinase n=1 Tax=bioreactor metagenome TaxID=1076179 RepID=A0A644UZ56_9ZZZZ|nr:NAD(+)/NADH kinase [Negativicutes bacterium]
MFTIGIFPNLKKSNIVATLQWIVQFLTEKGVKVLLSDQVAAALGFAELGWPEKRMRDRIDVAISLGGDGTLLSALRKISDTSIPIFGINMGRLGFLTEVEVPQIEHYLEKLINGHYSVERRLMLDAVIRRDSKEIFVSSALNDIVITKASYSRMIELELEINSQAVTAFSADGLIIATPTGSTGYSLSAGGPIVNSALNVILITPICPHTLASRPLIVSQDEEITVITASTAEDIVLTLDGQVVEKLQSNDKVFIRKSKNAAMFIKFGHKNYYQTLRTKLWRDD